jgi:hypothetical protein
VINSNFDDDYDDQFREIRSHACQQRVFSYLKGETLITEQCHSMVIG